MGALTNIVPLVSIAVLLAGMMAMVCAVAFVTPRRRAAVQKLGGVLILAGLFLPPKLSESPWLIGMQGLSAAVVLVVAGRAIWQLYQSMKQPRPQRDVHP